jgi:signal transduction histidine kinase
MRKASIVAALGSAVCLVVTAGHAIVPIVALLASLVALGWVTTTCDIRTAIAILAVTCLAFAVAIARDDSVSAGEGAQPIVLAMLVCGACVLVRRSVAARMEMNRLQLGLSLAEARAELARDVHDVTSHALMAVLTQLRVGRRGMAMGETLNAERALAQAEQAAGQAITDLRALTLIVAGRDTPLSSCHSLADVHTQISQACANFPTVTFEPASADNIALPPAVATTAIRVVQQCLANAAAHSPESPVAVKTSLDDGWLLIEAANPIGGGSGAGLKLGLAIMEHRVNGVGGTLHRGARANEFAVSCRLPIGVKK